MARSVFRFVLTLAVAPLALGCVAQAQYDSALDDLAKASDAHEGAKSELKACEDRLAALEGDFEAAVAERLAASEAELEELRRQKAAQEKRLAAFRELNDKLSELIAAGELEIYMRNGLPVIALPSQVLFASGKAELSNKGEKALKKVGSALAGLSEQRIQVAGHTDNMPIGDKLDWEDNWELSAARSLTVTRFLIIGGVDPTKLVAAGYGEFDPVASNDSGSGRKKNRRIELVLLPDLSELEALSGSATGEAAG